MAGTQLFEGFVICLLYPHPFSAPQKPFSCLLNSVFFCLIWVVWGSLCNLKYSGPSSHFSLKIYWYLAPEEAYYQWRTKTRRRRIAYMSINVYSTRITGIGPVTQWWAWQFSAIRVTVRKLGNEVFCYLETNAAKSISQVTTLKVQTLKVSNKFEGG